jgi:hypothetical protein
VRLLKYLSLPLLFLCVSIWLPPRVAQALRAQPSAISKLQTEQLEQMLAQLKEVAAVEPERSEALQEEIERLKQQTALTPLTHEDWAAFDVRRRPRRA